MQAFPCRCRLGDRERAGAVEEAVTVFKNTLWKMLLVQYFNARY